MKHVLKISLLLALVPAKLFCQETVINPMEKGVSTNLSEDGKYSIRLGCAIDFWTRYLQFNPGTKDFSGKPINNDVDFLLRRATTSTAIKLDRFFFFSAIGIGTQPFNTSVSPYTTAKPSIYFYDLFGSYEFVPNYLRIGYGLSLYRGLSRNTSASATRTIGADVPALACPDVATSEQSGRHFGAFATGNIGILSYRLVFGKPFIVNATTRPAYGVGKAADVPNNHYSYEGYFALQFLDKESNASPFVQQTYLGKKKIFNIGAGFYYHPKSTQSINPTGDTVFHNKLHLAVDLFLDLPMAGGGALTFYCGAFKFNYGPNFLLNGGTCNVYSTTSPAGAGISEPCFGTGNAISTQLAWLFPKVIGKTAKLQLYYEGDYRFYKALNGAALHHNIGVNYFVFAHQLKFTLQEEFRPYIVNGSVDSHKTLTIFRTVVYF